MAHMAVYLRSRPRLFLRASSPVHSSSYISHFSSSSSSSSDPSDEAPQNTENTQPSSRNSFSDVLAHLNGSDRQQSQQPPRPEFVLSQGARSAGPAAVEYDEIRKNLSGFTRRSAGSSGTSSFQGSRGQPPISLQSLYKISAENYSRATDGSQRQRPLSMSLPSLKGSLPHPVFRNELSEKPKKVVEPNELIKDYTNDELGEKLRNLRPEGVKQGQNWFSLSEIEELRRKTKGFLPNMSCAEKLKLKLKAVRDEFKTDCGSTRVQNHLNQKKQQFQFLLQFFLNDNKAWKFEIDGDKSALFSMA